MLLWIKHAKLEIRLRDVHNRIHEVFQVVSWVPCTFRRESHVDTTKYKLDGSSARKIVAFL